MSVKVATVKSLPQSYALRLIPSHSPPSIRSTTARQSSISAAVGTSKPFLPSASYLRGRYGWTQSTRSSSVLEVSRQTTGPA